MSTNQVLVPHHSFGRTYQAAPRFLLPSYVNKPWYQSLADNIRDYFFPEKLPPLRLTSRPVKVRDIWSQSGVKRSSVYSSVMNSG